MNNKINMTIQMEVTIPQALALQAMFEYWNRLSDSGSSRNVSFYVDGDGNFHPKCEVNFDTKLPELNDEIRKLAIDKDNNGHRVYDFDDIAWFLHKDK